MSTLCSATSLRTAGESGAPCPSLFVGVAAFSATGTAGFAGGAGAAGTPAALGAAAPALSPESMIASVVPTLTVSPAPTSILSTIPATSDGTSVATLSVSISTNNSSIATLSPSFLCQTATVPSSTVSPNCGMMTSITFPLPVDRDVFFLEEFKHALVGAFAADARLLDSAERRSRVGHDAAVEPDHARFDLLGDIEALGQI